MKSKTFLFDWGNTLMKDFKDEHGKMHEWNKVEAMPNAVQVLAILSKQTDCYIATNARDSEKEDIVKALQKVSLDVYFKDIFCYQELGFLKPSTAYFNVIIEALKVNKTDLIMIGDDLENDVKGAQKYGIEAILYDPNNKHSEYKGQKITDLKKLLEIKMA